MAVLTINGGDVKSPSEMKVSLFEVGSSPVRSASGDLVSDCIAIKRRIALRWAHMEPAELSLLLAAAGDDFVVKYPDPAEGMRTARFRCSEKAAGVLRITDGTPVWTDVSMEWTER